MKGLIKISLIVFALNLSNKLYGQAGFFGTVVATNTRDASTPTLTLTVPNTCNDVGNLKSGRIQVRNLSGRTANNYISSQSCFTIGSLGSNRNVWVNVTIPAGSGIDGFYFYSSTAGVTPQPTSGTNLRTAIIQVYNNTTCRPALQCGSTWDNAITDIRGAAPHIRSSGTERVDVVPGNTYRIEISTTTFSTDPNYNFDVFVVPLGPVPANTNCANAIPFTNQLACNLGAKAACNTNIPNCALTLENSVFYSFVKPGPGPFEISITDVSCEGGGNNLQSAIYLASTANCNTQLNTVGNQIANQCFSGSYTYTIDNNDPPGTEYIIWFDGNAGAACTWGIEVVAPCEPPTINLAAVSGSTCENEPVTISGNTFGGGTNTVTFTHNGNGSITPSVNATPFSFTYTPGALDAGNTIVITATTNSAGAGCDSVFQTYSLTVNPAPAASFSGLNSPYCLTDASINLVPDLSGGFFTGTGVSGNTFNPSIAGQGVHVITYNITSGGCSNSSTQTITVNPIVDPVFNPLPPICTGDPAPLLPSVSQNGISGSWDPSTVSNTMPASYIFTPTPGQCARSITLNTIISTSPITSVIFHN
jgi:hypothetical protein